ncbi:type II toxin-antitoxin system death-on-curing family toxin [Fodinisporobacter ferrooxydans]|uniref:Type II toxin-antitoxin system death-on-curing family toxin n=1 Tax=Fodinisporobacter ferrooxydans TaxID=2901836 RepID=A0ABY4CJF6_9BACL|nr:type II toxin-antitoxin system death-on-curing family toxin [Alicyclobacillaceae bacterium MYW30-H2]
MYIELTREQIVEIHDMYLNEFGGLSGEKEPGLISFMAEKPFTEYFGEEQYPGLFMKAAVYLEGFATKQLFNDGNKRTALACALIYLELNGYYITEQYELELYEYTIYVAENKPLLEEIASWLKARSMPY